MRPQLLQWAAIAAICLHAACATTPPPSAADAVQELARALERGDCEAVLATLAPEARPRDPALWLRTCAQHPERMAREADRVRPADADPATEAYFTARGRSIRTLWDGRRWNLAEQPESSGGADTPFEALVGYVTLVAEALEQGVGRVWAGERRAALEAEQRLLIAALQSPDGRMTIRADSAEFTAGVVSVRLAREPDGWKVISIESSTGFEGELAD